MLKGIPIRFRICSPEIGRTNMEENNCPFYGYAMVGDIEISTGGNQCALIKNSHSPCRMEMEGKTPDWKICPVLETIRIRLNEPPTTG
jgi:hypothetical protein